MKRYRYNLFGQAGSWSEYFVSASTKAALMPHVWTHLKLGHDAHIEDTKTGKVYSYKFRNILKCKGA